MQMCEVGKLIEVSTPEAAGKFIDEGWTLVTIVSGERYDQGQKSLGPIYVLGKPPEKPKREFQAML